MRYNVCLFLLGETYVFKKKHKFYLGFKSHTEPCSEGTKWIFKSARASVLSPSHSLIRTWGYILLDNANLGTWRWSLSCNQILFQTQRTLSQPMRTNFQYSWLWKSWRGGLDDREIMPRMHYVSRICSVPHLLSSPQSQSAEAGTL